MRSVVGSATDQRESHSNGNKAMDAEHVTKRFLLDIRSLLLWRIVSLFTCETSRHSFGEKSEQ